jgi:hypothetical protein
VTLNSGRGSNVRTLRRIQANTRDASFHRPPHSQGHPREVRRNADRFPSDFLLRLTKQEVASLRSHFAILKTGRGQGRKYPPLIRSGAYAFFTNSDFNPIAPIPSIRQSMLPPTHPHLISPFATLAPICNATPMSASG